MSGDVFFCCSRTNLRQVPAVLQKEIVMTGQRLFTAPGIAVDEIRNAGHFAISETQ